MEGKCKALQVGMTDIVMILVTISEITFHDSLNIKSIYLLVHFSIYHSEYKSYKTFCS